MKLHRILYFLTAICLLFLASCKEELDMTTVQKTLFEEASFDEIAIDDAWNVTILQDAQQSGVTLTYSAFLEPYIKAKKEGTAFELGFTNRLNLPFNTKMEATIYVKSLKSLNLDDASAAVLEGDFSGETLTLTLDHASVMRGGNYSGDTEITLDNASTIVEFNITGNTCHLHLDQVSVFKGKLDASSQLEIEMDNASRMTLYEGAADHAKVMLDNASSLNMLPLVVTNMEIEMENASEASVSVLEFLKGKLQNASKLYYQGIPALDVDCDLTSSCVPL